MVGKFSLQGARHLIWNKIIIEVDKFLPYIDFIADQENTMIETKKKVLTVLGEVQKRPVATTKNAIVFLSTLSDNLANQYSI